MDLPLRGQTVRLKSFDVDDPTPLADDPFLILDNTDGFGFETGGDNRGETRATPQAGLLFETVLTLDVLGEAVTFFTVTMQPGDNYRVAALLDTPGASNHLNALQVSLPYSEMYVGASDAPALGFVGALSPMLTVWRKSHLEFDSMTAPPANEPETLFVSAVASRIWTNWPVMGRSFVTAVWTNTAGAVDSWNEYERGKLEVSAGNIYRVLSSETKVDPGGKTYVYVVIDGLLNATNQGNPVKLYDDDNQYLANDPLYPSLLILPSPLPVIPSYRLAPKNPWPAQIEDTAAFTWMMKHVAEYGGDTNRVFIGGHSAGGHLTALLTLNPRYLQRHGLSPGVIRGVINLSGVYNLDIGDAQAVVFGKDRSVRREASPLFFVNSLATTFFVSYCEWDYPTLPAQARTFHAALRKAGIPSELFFTPRESHISEIIAMTHDDDPTGQAVVKFILGQAKDRKPE